MTLRKRSFDDSLFRTLVAAWAEHNNAPRDILNRMHRLTASVMLVILVLLIPFFGFPIYGFWRHGDIVPLGYMASVPICAFLWTAIAVFYVQSSTMKTYARLLDRIRELRQILGLPDKGSLANFHSLTHELVRRSLNVAIFGKAHLVRYHELQMRLPSLSIDKIAGHAIERGRNLVEFEKLSSLSTTFGFHVDKKECFALGLQQIRNADAGLSDEERRILITLK